MNGAHEGCLRAVRDALMRVGDRRGYMTPQECAMQIARQIDGEIPPPSPAPEESGMPTKEDRALVQQIGIPYAWYEDAKAERDAALARAEKAEAALADLRLGVIAAATSPAPPEAKP